MLNLRRFSRGLRWLRWSLAAAACALLLPAGATVVRFDTAYGPIDLDLYDNTAPRTVTNFLNYVRRGAYTNTFFHRHAANFVLQGGGFFWPETGSCCTAVTKDAALQNEYSANRPNVRGSVAMAKLAGEPNSATNEWFVNLVDNTTTLGPTNNGGFSVFGRVTAPSLAVVDAITRLEVVNAGVPYNNLPITAKPPGTQPLSRQSLVTITATRELATETASDSDRIFNYLEAAYPQFVAPASPPTLNDAGYVYRFYARTNAYVGTRDGSVYYLVPALGNQIQLLGTVAEWLTAARQAGY